MDVESSFFFKVETCSAQHFSFSVTVTARMDEVLGLFAGLARQQVPGFDGGGYDSRRGGCDGCGVGGGGVSSGTDRR